MSREQRPSTPFALALNTQREFASMATEAVERSATLTEQLERAESIEVGQTPSEVVHTENKLELLHYKSRTEEQHKVPILVVYALINKPFILDLQPGR